MDASRLAFPLILVALSLTGCPTKETRPEASAPTEAQAMPKSGAIEQSRARADEAEAKMQERADRAAAIGDE